MAGEYVHCPSCNKRVYTSPVTRPGDLWILGKHRLLCGDSTNSAHVSELVANAKISATVTDPPYGVGVDYENHADTLEAAQKLIDGFMPFVLAFGPAVLTPGIPAMWYYPRPAWLMAWVHPAPAGSCPWGFAGLNPILCYGKDPYLAAGLGRRPDSISLAADRQGVEGHPTPKPLAVWSWLVERVTTKANKAVYDPFTGSGTTIIACQQLNRRCFGLEIEPKYCDVALERWAEYTGRDPVRSDGEPFSELKKAKR